MLDTSNLLNILNSITGDIDAETGEQLKASSLSLWEKAATSQDHCDVLANLESLTYYCAYDGHMSEEMRQLCISMAKMLQNDVIPKGYVNLMITKSVDAEYPPLWFVDGIKEC